MGSSNLRRLKQFKGLFSSEHRVLIVINADPDSIGSALAVKRILWRKVAGITVANINVISRSDNLAMIRLLTIKLSHISTVDPEDYDKIVMVDSQPDHSDVLLNIKPDVIIDHHKDTTGEIPFKDIRPKYGATATILTEYLLAAKIKPSEKLASALYYAIKTDTSNFGQQTLMEDLHAFQYLFKFTNINLIKKIEQAEIPPRFLKYFRYALENKKFRKGWMFTNVGQVPNPDTCVLIADFFMRVNAVYWSVVAGSNNGKLIIVFRCSGYRRNAGKVAQRSFGQIGLAGGHKSMARAEISHSELKGLVDYENDTKLLNWVILQIKKRTGEIK